MLDVLGRLLGVRRLALLEGGGGINASFLAAGLVLFRLEFDEDGL